jgi:hypothetical protein
LITFFVNASGHLEIKTFHPRKFSQPFGIGLKIVKHSAIAVFKDEMQLPVPLEHLDQVDQVRMLQLLNNRVIELRFHCLP